MCIFGHRSSNHSAVLNLVNLPNEVLTIVCRDLAYWEIGHPNYPEHQASSKDAVEFSAACKVIRHVFQNLCEEISVTVMDNLISGCEISF